MTFQNWLPGLLEPNTDVQMCFSFFLKILPCRRICVMVWEEKIKGEMRGMKLALKKELHSLFS